MSEGHKLAGFTARSLAEISVTLIPVIGGPLGAAFTALELAAVSRRLDQFFIELKVSTSNLDSRKVDHAYLDTDAFVDVVMAALEAARRTSNRAKHRILAAILTGAASTDRPQQLDVEDVLVVLRDLSTPALALLQEILVQAKGEPVGSITTAIVPPTVPDREFLLNRLVAAGFVREMKISDFSPYQHYQPTDTLLRVVQLMEAGGWRAE